MGQFWAMRAAKAPAFDVEIDINEPIDGYSRSFVSELRRAGVKKPLVRLNTPGGSISAGLEIYHYLRELDTTVEVVGHAVSMGAVILQAGKRRRMRIGTAVMVHAPWTITVGDADTLRNEADALEVMEAGLKSIFARATGQPDDVIDSWHAKDTWFGPEDALKAGLVDEIDEREQAVAYAAADYARKHFNIPARFAGYSTEKMKLFGSGKPDAGQFALQVLAKVGLEGDELEAAVSAGQIDVLERQVASLRDQRDAEWKARFDAHATKLDGFVAVLAAAGLPLKVDATAEQVTAAVDALASKKLAELTAAAGVEKPVGNDGGTGGAKPGADKKGYARLSEIFAAELNEKGLK
jgi:ATP-dependent Clp endopeptidase proteolytic subunit ClpP